MSHVPRGYALTPEAKAMTAWTTARRITAAGVDLDGDLTCPGHTGGLVLFAHASTSACLPTG